MKRICVCIHMQLYIYRIVLYGRDISKFNTLMCKCNMSRIALGNETYVTKFIVFNKTVDVRIT